MRKNILSLSIAAMIGGLVLAGGASAEVVSTNSTATNLTVTPDGIGHILMVPYYSVQGGNATLFNLVNTDTTNGKAVKIRFRGASNSDDVLDFQVLMSPGDMWTAEINKNASTGVAQLVTSDNTCAIPQSVMTSASPFGTGRVNPALTGDAAASETREGYIEVLNMADIPPNALPGSLYTAIKHVNGVAPCYSPATAAAINNLFQNSITNEADAAAAGLTYPTTGLMANWYIFNVPRATSWSGAAAAVEARDNAGASAAGNIVMFRQANVLAPGLVSSTADPLFQTGGGTAIRFFDLPDLSTPYADADINGIGNLSAAANTKYLLNTGTATEPAAGAPLTFARSVYQASNLTLSLARNSVVNEYVTADVIGASTDWVISMPTRRYNVAMNYSQVTPEAATVQGRRFTAVNAYDVNTSPAIGGTTLVNFFNVANTEVLTGNNNSPLICVGGISQAFYDRSEGTYTDGASISPPRDDRNINFCGEVSVWSINEGTATSRSALAGAITRQDYTVASGAVDGWARFVTPSVTSGVGLPVLGGSFMQFVNPDINGVSGNFGLAFPHRYGR